MIRTESANEKNRPLYAPRADIRESGEAYRLSLEIPGAEEKSIRVTMNRRLLTVEARAEENAPEGFEPIRVEFRPGDYFRTFRIPEEVDAEAIQAEYHNGVLHVLLPKSREALPRKIEVKAA